MMKKTKYIAYIGAVVLLASCSQNDLDTDSIDSNEIITLKANVAGITEVASRSAVEADSYLDYPLNADIWFSTTQNVYKGTTYDAAGVSADKTSIDAHRTVSYTSANSPATPSDYNGDYLKYPLANTVYCIGMYPQGAWTASTDGETATATIDGIKDLMFAPQVAGSSSNKFGAAADNTQSYSHLLTWLKVRVRAEEDATAETWGKLQSITMTGNDKVSVNLSTGEPIFSNSSEDNKPATFTLYEPEGGIDLTTSSCQRGSILVAPVTADGGTDAEYTLHVKCKNIETDVPISLNKEDATAFSGNTAGKVFVITLYFKTVPYIEGTVTLVDLEEENRDLILE